MLCRPWTSGATGVRLHQGWQTASRRSSSHSLFLLGRRMWQHSLSPMRATLALYRQGCNALIDLLKAAQHFRGKASGMSSSKTVLACPCALLRLAGSVHDAKCSCSRQSQFVHPAHSGKRAPRSMLQSWSTQHLPYFHVLHQSLPAPAQVASYLSQLSSRHLICHISCRELCNFVRQLLMLSHCQQAVIFEVGDRNLIGYPTPLGYRYCCTKDIVPKTKCHKDRLIVQVLPHAPFLYYRNTVISHAGSEEFFACACLALSRCRLTSAGMLLLANTSWPAL